MLHGNSPDDAENVLFDTSDWAFIRNRVIVDRMRRRVIQLADGAVVRDEQHGVYG